MTQMTQRYAHLSPQYMAGAVAKLDAVFGEAVSGLPTLTELPARVPLNWRARLSSNRTRIASDVALPAVQSEVAADSVKFFGSPPISG
jgi:hypothetical protein